MTDELTGYGTDTWCADRYAPGRTASRRLVVAHALYRRITTPRGTLQGGPEEEVYGVDVSEYVGAVDDPAMRAALPSILRSEMLKDDRVIDAGVTISVGASAEGGTLRRMNIEATVALVDEAEPLTFTVGVSDVDVALLGVTE